MAENSPVRLIKRVRLASASPMRRLIANGGWVPAVMISTACASPVASTQTQLAETRLMKPSASRVTP
jgi:hypothetical protein